MAKLGSYFGLCPLIDQQNLLGISEDAEKGHVIVTLGRNIAVKYRVSDQKQIESWRTKDKFSSPVIYDFAQCKYVGVFNFANLKLWGDEDEHLDKLKKYNFNEPIYSLVSIGKKAYVIFKNGNIVPISTAMENRKELKFDRVFDSIDQEIQDVIHIEIKEKLFFGIIVNAQGKTFMYLTTIFEDKCVERFPKIDLNRGNVKLSGYVFCQMYNKHLHFLTLWSNKNLHSYQITGDREETPKGNFGDVYATIQSVSSEEFVAMQAISSDQIAIYGANPNQEGASLLIYNTQFKILQSKQTFKMFSKARKVWCFENSLFMCTGQNLAVAPFYINTEKLSALVGSHKIDPTETDMQQRMKISKWDSKQKNLVPSETIGTDVPSRIRNSVDDLLLQGLAESSICEHLIPLFVEKEDTKSLKACLDYFKDIPEKCIVNLLVYSVSKQLPIESEVTSVNCQMLDKIFALPISGILLLPYLKRGLDVGVSLYLIKYICYLLSLDGHSLPQLNDMQSEQKLIDWGCMLLDANYQKFLLTRDPKVGEVLSYFSIIVRTYENCLNDWKSAAPLCENIVKGRQAIHSKFASNDYSVKQIKLFK